MLMDVIYIYNRYDFYASAFASLHEWETVGRGAGPDFCHIFCDFKWPVFHMAMIGLRPRSAGRLSPNQQSFPPPNMPAPSCLIKLDSKRRLHGFRNKKRQLKPVLSLTL
jgi:hypothetical protein